MPGCRFRPAHPLECADPTGDVYEQQQRLRFRDLDTPLDFG